jgi:hypothetical protein
VAVVQGCQSSGRVNTVLSIRLAAVHNAHHMAFVSKLSTGICVGKGMSVNESLQNMIYHNVSPVFAYAWIHCRYICCNGACPCSGRMGESSNPELCLCLEVSVLAIVY